MARPERVEGNIAPQRPQGGSVFEDIRALNSSILLITQKIKYIVRNEKILGRNLIVLNKKIKTIEEKVVSPTEQANGGASSEEVVQLRKKVDLLENIISDLQSNMVTKTELKELRYVIDSINPLEFTTISQVKDLIEKSRKK